MNSPLSQAGGLREKPERGRSHLATSALARREDRSFGAGGRRSIEATLSSSLLNSWLFTGMGHRFWIGCLVLLFTTTGCRTASPAPAPRFIKTQQTWELQIGEVVAGHVVRASLGDISIELNGARVFAPFSGEVQPATQPGCIIFSSPEVPAYLFRMCGLRRPRLGAIDAGQAIGSGKFLHFATLRRQPDGTWVMVEPSSTILEQALRPDS